MRLRLRALLPFAWVVLPVLGACLVAILATEVGGPLFGLVLGGVIGSIAAFAIERPLRALARVAERIAGGDRYAIVPKQPKGPLSELAEAAESLRAAVIKADSLAVDQRRREAEARLHYAGRSFFTRRFRSAVDEVTNAFGRITADARIMPIWMSEGLIAPEPWSPWLDRGERDIARNGVSRETHELALAG